MLTIKENLLREADEIAYAAERLLPRGKSAVVLAIGSDRVTGDCLGPLAGYLMSVKGLPVYGTLRSPVTALNILETYETIRNRHPSSVIIAVDSAVGPDREIGNVKVLPHGLKPAAAAGRAFPRIGDISVVGVVSPQRLGAKALCDVRLGMIYSLANTIAEGLEKALTAKRRNARIDY